MNAKKFLQKTLLALGHVMPGVILLLLTRPAAANPTGLTVQSGSASAVASGSQLTVTAGNNAFLNWQSFNIAAGETTTFRQPSATSVVWNHINGQSPSQIYGSLQANGVVVLLNSSGFYFGPNSFVSAAGLVVSTANCAPPQNAGGAWEFNGPPPLASIVNYGQIKIGQGGSCYLIADQVQNHGDIAAPGGSVGLAAGRTVELSERPDGRGVSMKVTLPQGSVDNYGNILADGGTIALNAKVVNQDGLLQANSVQDHNGVIELVAGDQLNLGAGSKIVANGDDSPAGSAGGSVTLKSQNAFGDAAGSEISVAGGAHGGDGGTVEISAPVMPAIHSAVDGHAQAGATGGRLLLDPDYIVLDSFGGDSAPGGTVGVGDSPGGTLDLNVNSAFTGFSQITLQAAYDITLADFTSWNLSGTTGQSGGQLTLEAGRNIIFGNSTALTDANNWSVSLYAGVTDFAQNLVSPGAGSIYLNAFDPNNPNSFVSDPSGHIQMASGSIKLVAGQDITVGTGYVGTTGGGAISAHALAGNIDAGSDAQGYYFQSNVGSLAQAYNLTHGLGGISTAAGGDVNLTAGGDVSSVLPTSGGYYYYDGSKIRAQNNDYLTAGCGAYGPELGDVTIIAGGNVTGNYLVANGTGKIFAGVAMDASGNPIQNAAGNYVLGGSGSAGIILNNVPDLALNLIQGGWDVTAAQNIILQEVRNPNGLFDIAGGSAFDHYFDYAPGDFVNLVAGNQVQLGAATSVLPRAGTVKVPMIYPGSLNVTAGAGGVNFTGDFNYNQLILFPSPQGGLTLNTTDGGSVAGHLPASAGVPQIFNLVVSDSGKSQYLSSGDFGANDHAAAPVHLNNETPIDLNISGDLDLLSLIVPEAAQINVVGNLNNCRFQGMNLSASDVTSITVGQAAKINLENSGVLNPATDGSLAVGGDINNRSAFTSINLNDVAGAGTPNFSQLSQAIGNNVGGIPVSAATLATSFFYNPKTQVLTYQNIPGVSLAGLLNLLQNLTVQVVDQTGMPEYDASGNPVTRQVAALDAPTAAALLAKYNSLGPIPAGNGGYVIGGGGTFDITAANLDLGTTAGILSEGVGLYQAGNSYPLASLFNRGADVAINLTGDLTLYSSAVASLNGSSISIHAGGAVSVGSSDFTVLALGARGIFTTGQGDVSVVADGNIDVNGSRIAAYDGGNVTVESLHGDVNAGAGGSGYVVLNSFAVNPATHAVTSSSPTIPGSGILATTFPTDQGRAVGNILVETPNGNINASSGGIVELPLNGVNSASSIVDVLAGYELRDNSGNPVSAANIGAGTPVLVSTAEQNIDASGSGVIGQNVMMKASGTIEGIIFSKFSINLNANQFQNVTAVGKTIDAQGSSFGPTVTLIGTESVNASGAGNPSILSQNANGGGSSFAQGTAANATSSAAAATDASAPAVKSGTDNEDDLSKKKKKPISLARKVSRVTVLLPGQN